MFPLAEMTYEIPVWHPFVVHFPIALLVLGGGVAAAYAMSGRALWRAVTGLLVAFGTLGAWAANATGEALYAHVEGTPIVEELVGRHEALGNWTLALGAAATAVWLGVLAWRRRAGRTFDEPDPLGVRLAVAALALAAAVLVVLTGRLGGVMVWGVAS